MSDRESAQLDIRSKRERVIRGHAADWARMIGQWRAPRADAAVWLMYSANYLFNTGGLLWAVDPVRLRNRVPEAPEVDARKDLAGLKWALLTHPHEDHIDPELWSQLAGGGCRWVVPEFMEERFVRQVGADRAAYIVARPGREVILPGARVMPWVSPHGERDATGRFKDFPALGYRVETAVGTYLFPVDVRTYDPACLAGLAGEATVFAHVFLGRAQALSDRPPLLEDFVAFYRACRPRSLILGHLYELAREPEDCWRTPHVALVKRAFERAGASFAVTAPDWFEGQPL